MKYEIKTFYGNQNICKDGVKMTMDEILKDLNSIPIKKIKKNKFGIIEKADMNDDICSLCIYKELDQFSDECTHCSNNLYAGEYYKSKE